MNLQREVTIINKLGLHARAAAKLVGVASGFAANLQIRKGGKTVNGKSMMGILMLAAAQGSQLLIEAEGVDAEAALNAIAALIADRFGEEA